MARKSSVERAQSVVGGFATAKKNIVIQYQRKKHNQKNLIQLIRRDALAQGMKDEEIEAVDVYIKPEEQSVYYVINQQVEGKIAF